MNISQNHFHLPDWTSWVSFSLAQRRISLAPGNQTTVNVELCYKLLGLFITQFYLSNSSLIRKSYKKDETATYDYHWKCFERDNEIMKPSAMRGWGSKSTSLEFGLWSEIHQKIIVSYFI